MRRIHSVAAVAMMMATLLIVASASSLAEDFDLDGIDDGFFICDDDFDGFIECEDFFFDFGGGFVQGISQEAESGDVNLSFEVSSEGDNSNQAAPALQFGNTGNLQNAQVFTQSGSSVDDVDFEGSSFEFAPELSFDSDQSVRQSSVSDVRWRH